MLITTTMITKFDGFELTMTYCYDTPCIGDAL